MPRIRLTWREVGGDLPMVCAVCGRKARVLVTTEEKEVGGRYRGLFWVHRIANITLPGAVNTDTTGPSSYCSICTSNGSRKTTSSWSTRTQISWTP